VRDAAAVGARVLAGLAKGRLRLRERQERQSAGLARLVAQAAAVDASRGFGERGRAGRIARRLHGLVARRTAAKYLARLSSRASSSAHDAAMTFNTDIRR
jgi:hypothetical protein